MDDDIKDAIGFSIVFWVQGFWLLLAAALTHMPKFEFMVLALGCGFVSGILGMEW